jgi:hypothetical protein
MKTFKAAEEVSAGFEILKHHFPREHQLCSTNVLPRHYILKKKMYTKKKSL